MSETIDTLRSELFDTLRALKRKDTTLDIDRALAINQIAQTIINSAKVEVDAARLAGRQGSTFFNALPAPAGGSGPEPETPADGARIIAKRPGVTVTRHTLK